MNILGTAYSTAEQTLAWPSASCVQWDARRSRFDQGPLEAAAVAAVALVAHVSNCQHADAVDVTVDCDLEMWHSMISSHCHSFP